jgi:hypothetical protein
MYVIHCKSADEAFKALNFGEKFSRRSIRKFCTAYGRRFDIQARYAASADLLLHDIFNNRFSDKTVKVAFTNDTENLVLFSDVYNIDIFKLDKLDKELLRMGLGVATFQITYPELKHKSMFEFPSKTKMLSLGYPGLFRGNIVGVVVSWSP